MDINIREMEQDDWSEIVEVYFQGIQTNMATFEYTGFTYENWDKQHLAHSRLVAEIDGDVVAWAALTPFSDRECYAGVAELSIYVDLDHRHTGVGTELLKALVDSAVKHGVWSIQASILQENLACIGLHEKCGFKKVGVRERLGKDRFGVWRSVVIMEYRIQTDKAGGCDCALSKQQRKVD